MSLWILLLEVLQQLASVNKEGLTCLTILPLLSAGSSFKFAKDVCFDMCYPSKTGLRLARHATQNVADMESGCLSSSSKGQNGKLLSTEVPAKEAAACE